MVFGYYTIPLKTVSRNQLPPELPLESGAEFQCGLRVFHILWIPIFPFSKVWLMKKDGESYKVTPEAEQFFNQAFGRPKTPVYAFAGLIIAAIAFGYMKWNDSTKQARYQERSIANFEKQVNQAKSQLVEPTLEDYYQLKSEQGLLYAAKVDGSSSDSITLRFPTELQAIKNTGKEAVVKDFLLERKLFITANVAKSDLSKTMNSDKNAKAFKGTIVSGLGENKPLQLEKVHRIDPENSSMFVKDASISFETENVIKRFLENPSIDSSLVLLDAASKKYLLDIAKLSINGSGQEIKNYINASPHKEVDYHLLMFGRYSFAKTIGNKLPKSDEELLREFGFYTKLLDLGIWSIDDRIKETPVKVVYVKDKNKAEASVSAYSNILEQPTNIGFRIVLNKEGNEWKINLPSSWGYTENQISKTGGNLNEGSKNYRVMIRNSLRELDHTQTFDSALVY